MSGCRDCGRGTRSIHAPTCPRAGKFVMPSHCDGTLAPVQVGTGWAPTATPEGSPAPAVQPPGTVSPFGDPPRGYVPLTPAERAENARIMADVDRDAGRPYDDTGPDPYDPSGDALRTPSFGSAPVARSTDPETSHEAAASAEPSAASIRARVLDVLTDAAADGLTDEEIGEAFANLGWPGTPSGIRTRRKELTRTTGRGLSAEPPAVEDSGERRKTKAGRSTIVWRVIS